MFRFKRVREIKKCLKVCLNLELRDYNSILYMIGLRDSLNIYHRIGMVLYLQILDNLHLLE